MKKSLPALLVIGVSLLGLVSLLAHPFGAAKILVSSKPLLAGAPVDPGVMQIVERSCQNCHSEKTMALVQLRCPHVLAHGEGRKSGQEPHEPVSLG